ncbi:autotransporter domain-containing protein [Mesorhizobium retamae]|uniref:Autotransporter domain-containing protein n=1 Tax=Mesorhizobium retamae TaxID=2912854 RepID=A0ABS9QBV4_9HYPH|nr:autotransporter domain-containing protein [Mesorhizobium sp. IRAMC:0171]MCG7504885.1 autotransporter domain-containing protein [Mesorhizobium sp. IRAMC:0171]
MRMRGLMLALLCGTTLAGTSMVLAPALAADLDLNGGTVTLPQAGFFSDHTYLNGTGGVVNNNVGAASLTSNGGTANYAGWINQTAGAITINQIGGNITYINNSNNFTGGFNASGNAAIGTSNSNALGLGTITMDVGTTLRDDGIAVTLSNAIVLSGIVNLDSNTHNNFTIAGPINGNGRLTKVGLGTLILTGANGYTGGTAVDAGTLEVRGGNAIDDGNLVSIANIAGATLLVTDSETIGSLSGGGALGGAVAIAAGKTLTTGDNTANNIFAGVISGAGALIKRGTDTFTLTGANTYTGNTILNGGTLQLSGPAARLGSATADIQVGNAGSGALTVTGGAQLTSNDGDIGYGALGTAMVTGDNSLWTGHYISVGRLSQGTLNVLAGGEVSSVKGFIGVGTAGTATISGAGSKWTSDTSVIVGFGAGADGKLIVSDGGMIEAPRIEMGNDGGSAAVSLTGSAASGRGWLVTSEVVKQGGTATVDFDGGGIRATADTPDLFNGFSAGDVSLGAGGAFVDTNGHTVRLANPVDGNGGLVKLGAGTLMLAGFNTYKGITTVEAGILSIYHPDALGSILGGTVVLDGATLQLRSGAEVGGEQLNIAGTGVGGAGALNSTNSYSHYGGQITLTDDASIVSNGSGELTLGNPISGAYALTLGGSANGVANTINTNALVKEGSGTWTLTGDSALAGGTTISGGTLMLGDGGVTGSVGGDILNNSFLVVNHRTGQSTLAGAISGDGLLRKIEGGTLTLSGNNSYTGGTVIEGGTLIAQGGRAIGDNSAVVIRDAGTFRVQNDETVAMLSGGAGDSHGKVELNGTTLTLGSMTGATSLYWGGITGTGDLVKDGTFKQALAGNSDYIGDTRIMGGTLFAVGAGKNSISDSSAVTVGASAKLSLVEPVSIPGLESDSETIGSLSGAGTVEVGDKTLTTGGNGGNTKFSGVITGSGGLTKTGAGTLILSGANSYSGTTSVQAGKLQFGDGVNAGSGLAGNVTVLGGAGLAFDTPATFTLAGDGDLRDTASLSLKAVGVGQPSLNVRSLTLGNGVGFNLSGISNASQADQVLIESANGISGDFGTVSVGGFVGTVDYLTVNTRKSADGRQYLASYDLSWTAGNNLAHGTFTLGDASNSFTAGMDLADQVANGGWDGKSLTKAGSGTLILTGTNSYSGTTTVNAGTLQLGNGGTTGSVAGAIVNNGTLVFNRGDAAISTNAISGGGTIRQAGSGMLKLAGDSSGFAGSTSVESGILSVDGKLGGTVGVLSGARLQGIGTIGGLAAQSSATVAPGNSMGTLNVAGDISFAAGSTYAVEIAGNGASDRIAATGTATLGGGKVEVTALDAQASYKDGQSYTILTAAGGIIGGFDPAVLSRSAFLDATLAQGANTIDLKIALKGSKPEEPGKPGEPEPVFVKVADTYNRKQTAGALDTLEQSGAPLALYNKLLPLSVDEARAAFDGLSGEINASTVTGLLEDSRFVREAANDRLRGAFETVGAEPLPLLGYGEDGKGMPAEAIASELYGAWGSVFGSWGHGGDGNAARLNRSTGGFVTGVDGLVTDNWRLGFLTGYSHSSLKVDDRKSSASTDNYHLGIYGGTEWGALSLRSGLAYTWSEIDSARQAVFPGFADSLTSSYRAGTTQVFGELGYGLKAGNVALEPFANLAYVNVHTDGFAEQGRVAALTVYGGSNDLTFTTLGIRASTEFELGGAKATARGTIGWRHGFGDITPTVSQAFTGSSAFTIAGAPIARDAAVLEAGLDFAISPSAKLGVSYQGQVGTRTGDHGVRADLNVKF